MSTDTFIVRLPNKQIVSIVRTDSGRFSKIANRRIRTDGLIPNTVEISASYVAQLVARFGAESKNLSAILQPVDDRPTQGRNYSK